VTESVPEKPTKQDLMDAVQRLIASSRIVRAKVWNPYEELTRGNVDPKTIKAEPGSVTLPATIPDTIPSIASLGRIERRKFGLEQAGEGSTVISMSEEDFQKERERRRRAYVRWGKDNLGRFVSGNCSYFAAVTLGLLAGEDGLRVLPEDTVVELFGFAASDGHAFLVVDRDRDGGELGRPATWGPRAFAIDQWFARQRAGTPGSYAVKDVTGAEGEYVDPDFNRFVTQAMRGPTRFTHALLADPRDPL
jgi:hypothetical protein